MDPETQSILTQTLQVLAIGVFSVGASLVQVRMSKKIIELRNAESELPLLPKDYTETEDAKGRTVCESKQAVWLEEDLV